MGKVRVWIKQGCFLQHGYQVLHDSEHGKTVVLHVNSFALDLWQRTRKQAEGAWLCK